MCLYPENFQPNDDLFKLLRDKAPLLPYIVMIAAFETIVQFAKINTPETTERAIKLLTKLDPERITTLVHEHKTRPRVFADIDVAAQATRGETTEAVPEAQRLTDVRATLTELGVPSTLIEEIVELSERLLPLGALTYGRTLRYEEIGEAEGRGPYYNVAFGEHKLTVYVKGAGNDELATSPDKNPLINNLMPGYPGPQERISFDHAHRLTGACGVDAAILEFITAAIIFSATVKEHGWHTLDEALAAGVTIPLGVMEFPSLTDYFRRSITGQLDLLKNPQFTKDWTPEKVRSLSIALQRQLNEFRAGTVTMVVPDDRRVGREGNSLSSATIIGKTLRQLFNYGLAHGLGGAHGDNFYPSGAMAASDNVDLISLGMVNKNIARFFMYYNIKNLAIKALEVQKFANSPDDYPNFKSQQELQRCARIFANFLREFGKNLIHPKAMEKLQLLQYGFWHQICAGLADLIIDNDTAEWQQTADQMTNLASKYSTDLKLPEWIAENHTPIPETTFEADRLNTLMTDANDPLGFKAIKEFLKTGNYQLISHHKPMGVMAQILEMVPTIPNDDDFDQFDTYQTGIVNSITRIQNLLARIFLSPKNYTAHAINLIKKADVTLMLFLAKEKLEEKNYNDVVIILENIASNIEKIVPKS